VISALTFNTIEIRNPSSIMPTLSAADLPKGVHLPKTPSSHFDYRQATNSELMAHGLPPRPNEAKKFARWDKIMSSLKRFIEPTFRSTGVKDTDRTWCGAVVTASDLAKGESFTEVQGTWIVPSPYPPQAKQGTYGCISWVGLDGYVGSTDLIRAGTWQSVGVDSSGEVTSQDVTFWCKWSTGGVGNEQFLDFPISFGDTVLCDISSGEQDGDNGVNVFILNQGPWNWTSFFIKAPDNTTLKGDSAQWIMQNPSDTKSPDSMAEFGSTFFFSCFAVTNYDTWQDLSNATPILMVNSNGTVIVDAVKENDEVIGIFSPCAITW